VVNTAREYLRSIASPDATHAGVVNVYQGKYKHVILPRVATDANGAPDSTKRGYWGIASSQMSSFYLGIWEQPHLIPPAANSNSEDVQTDDWEFRKINCGSKILSDIRRKLRCQRRPSRKAGSTTEREDGESRCNSLTLWEMNHKRQAEMTCPSVEDTAFDK